MTVTGSESQGLFSWFIQGGFAMIPLLICSLFTWGVIIERAWKYYQLSKIHSSFFFEVMNRLLQGEIESAKSFCDQHQVHPTAQILKVGLTRMNASDPRIRRRWAEAMERQRKLSNQDLRRYLWILGTIGAASPFIGLFGTVVGILDSFSEISKAGAGGFAVVSSGISEALIATATGIVVAVVAVVAFNTFQAKWNGWVLRIRTQTEELMEILENLSGDQKVK